MEAKLLAKHNLKATKLKKWTQEKKGLHAGTQAINYYALR
jgi:hypothetical protein